MTKGIYLALIMIYYCLFLVKYSKNARHWYVLNMLLLMGLKSKHFINIFLPRHHVKSLELHLTGDDWRSLLVLNNTFTGDQQHTCPLRLLSILKIKDKVTPISLFERQWRRQKLTFMLQNTLINLSRIIF